MTDNDQEQLSKLAEEQRDEVVIEPEDETEWDVIQDLRGHIYKIRVKIMTMGDGLNKQNLWTEIAERVGFQKDRDLDNDMKALYLVQNWPLLLYGTEKTEGVAIPKTEEDFWNLPEVLVLEWVEAIRENNPQHSIPFAQVQKMLSAIMATKDIKLED